jgi:SAM-dependent MidA family methyltransferase
MVSERRNREARRARRSTTADTPAVSVGRLIREAIRNHGPITFAEYMELALYGPGGFYQDPPVGPRGDFVTGPHVHPVFGPLMAYAIRELHEALGGPSTLRIAEAGAGDGTLARQLIDALADIDLDYLAVERSSGALAALRRINGVTASERLPQASDVVVANELLDNLPFRRIRAEREVRVDLDGDHFVEVEVPWDGEPGPEGVETIVPDGALAFVDRLAEVLAPGYALIVDYGAVGSPGGEVHGYRANAVVDDLFTDPGSTDLTVGIDFALVARRAEERGLLAFPTVTQRAALVALGFADWTRTELADQHRRLDERDGLGAVRAWSGRSRATLLVDPTALGRLRWLLLASPGLAMPPWLQRASPGDLRGAAG